MLKSQADYLIRQNPRLAPQIQAGLLLAVAGRVKPIGDPAESLTRSWEVLGETYVRSGEGSVESPQGGLQKADGGSSVTSPSTLHSLLLCKTYTVRDLDTTPRRWSCNCEQGQTYGPLTVNFLGHTGHICKHIAAVTILWLQCEYPEKPVSLYDLFTQLVQEQAIYLVAGEAVELPTPHGVKIEYYDKNGQSGLCLKTGKARSGVLARWLPKMEAMSGGEWRLVGEARVRYQEFVIKINGGS